MEIKGDPVAKVITRFNLAKAWKRFAARLLDFALLFGILVGLAFAIFNTSTILGWQVFLVSLLVLLVLSIYFIFIPFFWNGWTLFKRIFKIRTYSVLLKTVGTNKITKHLDPKFLLFLFKKEVLIWFLWAFVFFIFGIVCISMGNSADSFIKELLKLKNPNPENPNLYFELYGSIFISLFALCFIIDFGLMISLFINSGKRSFHDLISNTIVIDLKGFTTTDIDANENKIIISNKKIKYSLPGEISRGALDEM